MRQKIMQILPIPDGMKELTAIIHFADDIHIP